MRWRVFFPLRTVFIYPIRLYLEGIFVTIVGWWIIIWVRIWTLYKIFKITRIVRNQILNQSTLWHCNRRTLLVGKWPNSMPPTRCQANSMPTALVNNNLKVKLYILALSWLDIELAWHRVGGIEAYPTLWRQLRNRVSCKQTISCSRHNFSTFSMNKIWCDKVFS